MLVLFTQKPSDCLVAVRKMIKDGDIATWKYTIPNSGITRLDWIGGNKGNWKNLTDDVYFTAESNTDEFEGSHVSFKLHTKRHHHLENADYAVMHSELLQMLFAHLDTVNIGACVTYSAPMIAHKVDVVDD